MYSYPHLYLIKAAPLQPPSSLPTTRPFPSALQPFVLFFPMPPCLPPPLSFPFICNPSHLHPPTPPASSQPLPARPPQVRIKGGVQADANYVVSDGSVKKDIATAKGSLDLIHKLRGVTHTYINDAAVEAEAAAEAERAADAQAARAAFGKDFNETAFHEEVSLKPKTVKGKETPHRFPDGMHYGFIAQVGLLIFPRRTRPRRTRPRRTTINSVPPYLSPTCLQEVEQVVPELVTTLPEGLKAVQYEKMTVLLTEVSCLGSHEMNTRVQATAGRGQRRRGAALSCLESASSPKCRL